MLKANSTAFGLCEPSLLILPLNRINIKINVQVTATRDPGVYESPPAIMRKYECSQKIYQKRKATVRFRKALTDFMYQRNFEFMS